MKKIFLEEKDITLENLNNILNDMFYEVRSISKKYDTHNLYNCVDGCPRKDIIGVMMLRSYLNGSGYVYAVDEVTGKWQYFNKKPINPQIIYDKINDLIDYINNEEQNIINNTTNELEPRKITTDDLNLIAKPACEFIRMSKEEKEQFQSEIRRLFVPENIQSFHNGNGIDVYAVQVSNEFAKLLDFNVNIDNKNNYVAIVYYVPQLDSLEICRKIVATDKSRGTEIIGRKDNYFDEKGDIAKETITEILNETLGLDTGTPKI